MGRACNAGLMTWDIEPDRPVRQSSRPRRLDSTTVRRRHLQVPRPCGRGLKRGTEVRRSTAARPPSGRLTGTPAASRQLAESRRQSKSLRAIPDCLLPTAFCRLAKGEPELLIGRCGGTSVFLGRQGFGPGQRGLGNEPALEPVKMFGAVRGYASRASASRNAETVPAAVRTVKLSTSYFLAETILSPSGVRPLDGLGHKEVRRRMLIRRSAGRCTGPG